MGSIEGKMKPDRSEYQKTLMELIGCRPVAYWPALARKVGGVKAAVMLSQLMYWHGDESVKKRAGNWILKSVSDLEKETGLTKLEQQTARDILSESGVIEAVLSGIPRIWHYRVNQDRLTDILIGSVSHPMGFPSNGKPIQHSTGKPSNIDRETDPILGGFDSQLNNVLKTTDLRLHTEITTSSSSATQNEEQEVLTDEVLTALDEIGVFEALLPEVQAAQIPAEIIFQMIDQAKKKEPDQPAGLFMFRVRNYAQRPKRVAKTAEDRERQERNRYAQSLKRWGITSEDDPQ